MAVFFINSWLSPAETSLPPPPPTDDILFPDFFRDCNRSPKRLVIQSQKWTICNQTRILSTFCFYPSPYVDSRVDSNTFTMGNHARVDLKPMPESTLHPGHGIRIWPLGYRATVLFSQRRSILIDWTPLAFSVFLLARETWGPRAAAIHNTEN